MVQRHKTGKQRQDTYYYLAKEQGLRARSAFKLIQLAQKFKLFDQCSSVIDLCAAPGGWMQVCRAQLPANSVIIGVDIANIKRLKDCISIRADITTDKCRQMLRSACDQGHVDLVLHDGAPNVGSNWVADAYAQNELVLHSLKLAHEFLRPGGKFVTKVFRSKDYQNLVWIFQQLFERVEVSKPLSSRHVSAEIFVVCLGMKNAKVDPKFFDPKFAFLEDNAITPEMTADSTAAAAVAAISGTPLPAKQAAANASGLRALLKTQNKRHRSGYEEGDLFRTCTVDDFLDASNPAMVLVQYHKIKVAADSERSRVAMNSPKTTDELKRQLDDLKLLSRADMAGLLRWRTQILKEIENSKKLPKGVSVEDINLDSQFALLSGEVKEGVEVKDEFRNSKQNSSGLDREGIELRMDRELRDLEMRVNRLEKRKAKKTRKRLEQLKLRMRISQAANNDAPFQDESLFCDPETSGKILETEAQQVSKYDPDTSDDENSINNNNTKTFSGIDVEGGDDDQEEEDDELPLTPEEEIEMSNTEKRLKVLEDELKANYEEQLRQEYEMGKRRALLPDAKLTRRKRVFAEWAQEMQEFHEKKQEELLETYMKKTQVQEDDAQEDAPQEEEAGSAFVDGNDDNSDDNDSDREHHDSPDDENENKNLETDKELMALISAAQETEIKAQKATKLTASASRFFDTELFEGLTEGVDEAKAVLRANAKATREKRKRKEAHIETDSFEPMVADEDGIVEIAEKDLPVMPKTDKEQRHEKRLKTMQRQENKLSRRQKEHEAELEGLGHVGMVGERAGMRHHTEAPLKVVPKQSPLSATPPPVMAKPSDPQELSEIQAIGSLLAKKKSRMDLIDGTYNRYAYDDDEDMLPAWFTAEEKEYRTVNALQMTKEIALAYKNKLREINTRPIRKVLEASQRKKLRQKKQMDKVRRKALEIADSTEINGDSKAKEVRKMIAKVKRGAKPKPVIYRVAKKTGGASFARKRVKGTPKRNAAVKVVDKRFKKDARGAKRAARRKAGKK